WDGLLALVNEKTYSVWRGFSFLICHSSPRTTPPDSGGFPMRTRSTSKAGGVPLRNLPSYAHEAPSILYSRTNTSPFTLRTPAISPSPECRNPLIGTSMGFEGSSSERYVRPPLS